MAKWQYQRNGENNGGDNGGAGSVAARRGVMANGEISGICNGASASGSWRRRKANGVTTIIGLQGRRRINNGDKRNRENGENEMAAKKRRRRLISRKSIDGGEIKRVWHHGGNQQWRR